MWLPLGVFYTVVVSGWLRMVSSEGSTKLDVQDTCSITHLVHGLGWLEQLRIGWVSLYLHVATLASPQHEVLLTQCLIYLTVSDPEDFGGSCQAPYDLGPEVSITSTTFCCESQGQLRLNTWGNYIRAWVSGDIICGGPSLGRGQSGEGKLRGGDTYMGNLRRRVGVSQVVKGWGRERVGREVFQVKGTPCTTTWR